MKNFSIKWVGMVVLWLLVINNLIAQNINRVEYFIDHDPGAGNGTALTITPGTTVSQTFSVPLSTPDLSTGIHRLFIRARDANNNWSFTANVVFFKDEILSPYPVTAITQVEYFFDNDPGFGNGTAVNFTTGTTINDLSFNAILPGSLSNGIHKLTIRAKNSEGKWSTAAIRPIYKDNVPVTATLPNINRVEYFIDTDPGFGNGTAVSISPNTTLSNVNFTAELTGLSNGKHILQIRARNANNQWSTVGIREFVVCSNPSTASIAPSTEQNTCGTPVNLSVPEGFSYQWRLNGVDIQNANAKTYTASQTGEYSVVMGQNGCLFTTSPVRININSTPAVPTIITPNQTICTGSKIMLESSGCNGLVTWSNGSTSGAIEVSPTTTTTYTATCTLNGCISDMSTNSCVITVNPALAAPIISGSGSAVCPGSVVSLTASGCAGIVTWSTGQTGTALSVAAKATGTYSAICTSGVCTSGASNVFTVNVTNSTANAMSLSVVNSKICSGQSSTLIATGCSGSIVWSNGSTGSNITVSPTSTGTYTATCTHNTCGANSVNTVQVQVIPLPTAPVIYGQSETICQGVSRTLSAYFCVGGVITWSNGFVGQTQTVKPGITTTYTAICTKEGCASVNSNAVTLTISTCAYEAVSIAKLEYFIDNDPGFNNGTNIPITSASALSSFNISIPLGGSVANGFHYLSIRAKDSNNKWSYTAIRPFWKDALPSSILTPNVVKLEYFIDNDPGVNNGTNIPISEGTTITNLAVSIPLDNSLAQGIHNLTIRAKDANNKWSMVTIRKFYKDALPASTNLANITRLEYFIDTDPGFGNGTNIPVTANSSITNIPLVVNMTGLSQGTHHLEIRARDANGKWSTVGIKQFNFGTNRIAIGTIATEICGQSSLSLPYTLEGTFVSGNTLTVQLLDVNNNVVNGNLATITATTNDNIIVPIPNVTANTIYKLRLVSSTPEMMSDPVQITIKPGIEPVITASGPTTFCSGRSVLLTVSNCSGSVIWSNGITNQMISVITSGTFSATCQLTNGCSLPSGSSVITTVEPYPAPANSGSTSVCGVNKMATLTASGCDGGNFAWYTSASGGTSQFVGNPYVTAPLSSTTTFYVACISTDGCASSRIPATVTVKPLPTVNITGTNNLNCVNTSVTRIASGGGTYLWSNSLGTNATATITDAGTYTVTVTGANGCTATATTVVTREPTPPTPTITSANPSSICSSQSATLTANGCTGLVTWSNGSTGSTINVSPVLTTNYTANCKIGQCTGSNSTPVTVTVTPNCTYPITIQPALVVVCPNTPVMLTASGCPGTITWTGGATGTSIIITPTVSGTYAATCSAGGSSSRAINVGASNVTLSSVNNIVTGTAKFQVIQSITSSSQLGQDATNPKPNVLYQAGKSILLEPGFTAVSGSVFSAIIQGCN